MSSHSSVAEDTAPVELTFSNLRSERESITA